MDSFSSNTPDEDEGEEEEEENEDEEDEQEEGVTAEQEERGEPRRTPLGGRPQSRDLRRGVSIDGGSSKR